MSGVVPVKAKSKSPFATTPLPVRWRRPLSNPPTIKSVLSDTRVVLLGSVYTIGLTHTIDAAHRVVGHEGGKGKCARLHGHTYTFDIELDGWLDSTGFVVDYGVVKRLLDEWDHRTVLWVNDPLQVVEHPSPHNPGVHQGVVRVDFNPTAENLARNVADRLFALPGVKRARVTCRETAKSFATWESV